MPEPTPETRYEVAIIGGRSLCPLSLRSFPGELSFPVPVGLMTFESPITPQAARPASSPSRRSRRTAYMPCYLKRRMRSAEHSGAIKHNQARSGRLAGWN